jgi:hypothetical protein
MSQGTGITKLVSVAIVSWNCTREMLSSNLSRVISCATEVSVSLAWHFQENFRMSHALNHDHLLAWTLQFTIHYPAYNSMLCNLSYWQCYRISHMDACNETNLMHYLSSVYSVTLPLHASDLLVSHHQEVAMYICNKWYVLYVLVDCQLAGLRWSQSGQLTVN